MPARTPLIWALLLLALITPLVAAGFSPLLAYRQPIYIAAGFAGILGFGLLVLQPLLARGALPGLHPMRARRLHRAVGGLLLGAVLVHVGALWITSPPDVLDALLLRSPTPFSLWGVIAMWAIFATALIAAYRRKLRPRHWRLAHLSLACLITGGTILHALLIDGTMEQVTKLGLCALAALALISTLRSPPR